MGNSEVFPAIATQAVVEAYRQRGLEGLADFPTASFYLQDRGRQILGRGLYSGTALYFKATPASKIHSISPRLRALGQQVGYRPDLCGVRDYLCYGFVPAPGTVFQNIKAVPPGQVCLIENGSQNWLPLPGGSHEPPADPVAEFRRRLDRSVRDSQATAVLLSGGLDSATIAAAARQAGRPPVAYHARFSAVPPDRDEDTAMARLTARHLALPYREIAIRGYHALRYFERVVQCLEQPLGDPVTLPFYLLLRQLGNRHTHVLTGEGGDQLFGSWALKPMLLRESYSRPDDSRSRAYLEGFHKFAAVWQDLLAPPLADALNDLPEQAIERAWTASPATLFCDRLRWVDIQLKGLQHILPRIEAMGHSQGIRLHHPFFDPALLDLSFALPDELKLHGAREKVLLKQWARSYLPEPVRERRKCGMGVPTSAWFRRALKPLLWRWLSHRSLRRNGLLNPAAVRGLLKGDLLAEDARVRRWGDRLWMLCVLECWFATLPNGGKSR